ncbi:MAG: SLC13 family permease [Novosphingobium sp.]
MLLAVRLQGDHPPAAVPGDPVRAGNRLGSRGSGPLSQTARGAPAQLAIAHALTRIDMSAIVFFVGILLAVAVLEHAHILAAAATWLDHTVGRLDVIVVLFGLASAVVDNVPTVAAAMGMYSLDLHLTDSFRGIMAYCVGTGGWILV